jgi:excinuclease UvrABC nuclease subunit
VCRDPAYRAGKLLGERSSLRREHRGEDDAAVLSAYLARTYVTVGRNVQSELLVPFDFEDREAIEASTRHARRRTAARTAARARGSRQQNARHLLEELKLATLESEERATSPVYELERALGLQRLPRSHRVLRHFHRAGHRHRGLVRVVRERAPAACGVSQVQGEDGRWHRRLRVDA